MSGKKREDMPQEKDSKKEYISAVGRRRAAVARVRLYPAKDGASILVNKIPIEQYFSGNITETYYTQPLRLTNTLDKFTITAKVEGGGKSGQLDALVLAIARALVAYDQEKFRPLLKKKGFLTRDSRIRERRKVGTGGKARRKKQSPKR